MYFGCYEIPNAILRAAVRTLFVLHNDPVPASFQDVVVNEPLPAWPALLDFEHAGDRIGWSAVAALSTCGSLGACLSVH